MTITDQIDEMLDRCADAMIPAVAIEVGRVTAERLIDELVALTHRSTQTTDAEVWAGRFFYNDVPIHVVPIPEWLHITLAPWPGFGR